PPSRTGSDEAEYITLSGRYWHAVSDQLLEPVTRKFVRWIGLPADITHDAMTPPDTLPHLVNGDAERLAGRKPAANDWRAVGPNHDTVKRPARRCKVQCSGAHVRFQLRGASFVGKAERLRVHRPASNKNGQAASGPAVLVERRVDVDNKALSQA